MTVKPHIVHVLGTLGTGGAQRIVLEMITSPVLQAYRHSIVCAIARQGEFLESYHANHIPVYLCPFRWPASTVIPSYRVNRWLRNHLTFTFPWRFARLLRELEADLVHTQLTAQMYLQARAVARHADLPWIWTLHGLYRSRGEDVSQWPRTVNLVRNTPAAAITAVSRAALEEVLVSGQLPPQKARVIPNGIDISKFDSSIPRDPEWRVRWAIPHDALLFGTAGRLIEVKRHDIFLEAAARLIQASECPSAHFAIAGDGHLRHQLEEHVRRLGIESSFHLLGYQSDMRRFMRELDVFVLPSDSEGFPNVLLEACAMRLPCIATAVGGVPEVLSDNAGILIEPGSVDALAQAMQQMLSPETRKMYARRARTVAERFSIEETARQYASLYEELLACR